MTGIRVRLKLGSKAVSVQATALGGIVIGLTLIILQLVELARAS